MALPFFRKKNQIDGFKAARRHLRHQIDVVTISRARTSPEIAALDCGPLNVQIMSSDPRFEAFKAREWDEMMIVATSRQGLDAEGPDSPKFRLITWCESTRVNNYLLACSLIKQLNQAPSLIEESSGSRWPVHKTPRWKKKCIVKVEIWVITYKKKLREEREIWMAKFGELGFFSFCEEKWYLFFGGKFSYATVFNKLVKADGN